MTAGDCTRSHTESTWKREGEEGERETKKKKRRGDEVDLICIPRFY